MKKEPVNIIRDGMAFGAGIGIAMGAGVGVALGVAFVYPLEGAVITFTWQF